MVKPVYYGHLGTNQKYPDYQGVLIFQVSLYDKAPFRTTTKSVWIMQVSLFSSVLINRFHCSNHAYQQVLGTNSYVKSVHFGKGMLNGDCYIVLTCIQHSGAPQN